MWKDLASEVPSFAKGRRNILLFRVECVCSSVQLGVPGTFLREEHECSVPTEKAVTLLSAPGVYRAQIPVAILSLCLPGP